MGEVWVKWSERERWKVVGLRNEPLEVRSLWLDCWLTLVVSSGED
jgi:hypothetical protein